MNADYQPLSYFPLSVVTWKEAIKALFLGRVDVVANYDEEVRSPTFSMHIPSVVVLKDFVARKDHPPFTRFNLYLRDAFECQYCGSPGYIRNYRDGVTLTLDHVHPRARGGHKTWENMVAACASCNVRKACRTPYEAGMKLRNKPRIPTERHLMRMAKAFPPNFLHETWRDYLYWDEDLSE
ncbi:MAG: HNH endonuclease [Proteobacteria bacterium]|nr:HNH endonuclease [Pseudomonadota bacterium]